MNPTIPENATRAMAKDQDEYFTLHIRDEPIEGGGNVMVSEWEPSPDELALLNAGGRIVLGILGTVHPPVILTVKEAD